MRISFNEVSHIYFCVVERRRYNCGSMWEGDEHVEGRYSWDLIGILDITARITCAHTKRNHGIPTRLTLSFLGLSMWGSVSDSRGADMSSAPYLKAAGPLPPVVPDAVPPGIFLFGFPAVGMSQEFVLRRVFKGSIYRRRCQPWCILRHV
jgi:hypothetical protein